MWDGWVDVERPRIHILGHWNYGGAGAASADGDKLNGARPSSGAAGFEAQPAAQKSGDPTRTRPAAPEDGRTPVKADAFGAGAAVKKSVYVVSSADAVELFLNGKSLGKGAQTNRFLFTFENVVWRPGQLRAVGYDARGDPVCVAAIETAGDPSALKLAALTGPGGLKADGADVALVQVEVVDSEGRRCPTALNTVAFSLTGPAEWRGGIAQGPD